MEYTENDMIQRGLGEAGHYLLYFVLGFVLSAGIAWFSATETTVFACFIQKGVLGGTGALKLSVFQENEPYGHEDEKQRHKPDSQQQSSHSPFLFTNLRSL
jgi:hypothetical protein